MQTIKTIGLDIAKSVFQVHGVDAAGNVIIRRQLKRRYVVAFFQKLPPCQHVMQSRSIRRSGQPTLCHASSNAS
jgi:transposase